MIACCLTSTIFSGLFVIRIFKKNYFVWVAKFNVFVFVILVPNLNDRFQYDDNNNINNNKIFDQQHTLCF